MPGRKVPALLAFFQQSRPGLFSPPSKICRGHLKYGPDVSNTEQKLISVAMVSIKWSELVRAANKLATAAFEAFTEKEEIQFKKFKVRNDGSCPAFSKDRVSGSSLR